MQFTSLSQSLDGHNALPGDGRGRPGPMPRPRRLRRSPADRDPVTVGERLADDRQRLTSSVRAQLPRSQRRLFDVGLRAAGEYQSQREATKAAAVRLLLPIRLGLAELARRSAFTHDDFFLRRLDEAGAAAMRAIRWRAPPIRPAQAPERIEAAVERPSATSGSTG